MTLEQHDDQEIRCLQLGGRVTFNYCRRVSSGVPCKLIIGCWQGRLEVVPYLAANFSAEQLRQAFQPPPGTKLERLIALVERSRANLGEQSTGGHDDE